MRHGSLFSGIGGFDLAAEWMGWENVFHCDNNNFCKRILKYYWPNAEQFDDIKQSSFSRFAGTIDVLSGGFPCQPYSNAGKRKGKDDGRHLWPEMLRAIREIQPRWVVGENVPGLLNWKGGMVLKEIKTDLEAAEFEVFPPLILPACGKNAPHRRDRLWIVAHSINGKHRIIRNKTGETDGIPEICGQTIHAGMFNGTIGANWITPNAGRIRQEKSEKPAVGTEQFYESGIITNTNNQGLQGGEVNGGFREIGKDGNKLTAGCISSNWQEFPTVSPIRGRDDGLSSKLVKQCLEGLGNAVVPQIVFEIFKAIEEVETTCNT